ncbi:MAG TPA: HAD family phosphatase, partial [Sphingomonas sp.]
SSSSTAWIARHLEHIGVRDAFGDHLYSGREHVTRGKPAPDLYLHAAGALGVAIEDCAIIEDSPVGATGAVASGAYVIGLCAGTHCPPDHAARLRAIGVDAIAADFAEVARLIAS